MSPYLSVKQIRKLYFNLTLTNYFKRLNLNYTDSSHRGRGVQEIKQ